MAQTEQSGATTGVVSTTIGPARTRGSTGRRLMAVENLNSSPRPTIFKGRHFYPGAMPAQRNDLTEGLHICIEPAGSSLVPDVGLVAWESVAHFEVIRATKKKYGQSLVRLEGLRLSCSPGDLADVFRWTVGEMSLLSESCESDRDKEILKIISLRWQELTGDD